ncbi:hypothetical protein [Tautonia rosea]|uniref:hypothetical protein n=1 Tax=Tautonia rosea TaxID=2728037 RepID=UPI0014751CBD|nr:hypothetical protein [Tautonia rosea]
MRRPLVPLRRPGIALTAVLAQLTLLFMAWSLANRQCTATIGMEEALSRRTDQHAGTLSAIAVGLGLLETGLPAEDKLDEFGSYSCFVMFLDVTTGTLVRYTLIFQRLPVPDPLPDPPSSHWSLTAVPYDPVTHLDVEGPMTTFEPPHEQPE